MGFSSAIRYGGLALGLSLGAVSFAADMESHNEAVLQVSASDEKLPAPTGAPAPGPVGLNEKIRQTYDCHPKGQHGGGRVQLTLQSESSYESVLNKGPADVTAKATIVEAYNGSKRVLSRKNVLLQGTAEDTERGIAFDLSPIDASSEIDEISLDITGGSVFLKKNDEVAYEMECVSS